MSGERGARPQLGQARCFGVRVGSCRVPAGAATGRSAADRNCSVRDMARRPAPGLLDRFMVEVCLVSRERCHDCFLLVSVREAPISSSWWLMLS